jgi:hypothetical protein
MSAGKITEGDRVEVSLDFTADEVVDAALVQDEIAYAGHTAISESAAIRHFGKAASDVLL